MNQSSWFSVVLLKEMLSTIEPSGRRTRRAFEEGEKYCPLSKIEVKKKL